jgi:hypothetical protein
MSRIDYERCPDWIAFAAQGRRMRAEEAARISTALAAWIGRRARYALSAASTPISRDTRIGVPGR